MLNSQANGSSMKKPITAITAMIARSSQRWEAFVCMAQCRTQAPRGQELERW